MRRQHHGKNIVILNQFLTVLIAIAEITNDTNSPVLHYDTEIPSLRRMNQNLGGT